MDEPNPQQEAAKQWHTDARIGITPQFMYEIFLGGLIGTKEFRGWLAKHDQTFADVRDADVDNEIDRLARERAEQIRNLQAESRDES